MSDPMEEDSSPPKNFVVMAALFEGGLAVAAVLLGRMLGCAPLDSLHWTSAGLAWGLLGAVPPLIVFFLVLKVPLKPLASTVRVVDEVLVPVFAKCRTLELAIISLLAGLGEEMLFRIIVQQALADWVGGSVGLWVGLAVAAILFGMLHLITPMYGLLAGAIGLYLGWMWIASGNLLAPITTHAVYDFVALVYLVRIRKRRQP
jgi:membrane protease YdiL (CAAX protease family)